MTRAVRPLLCLVSIIAGFIATEVTGKGSSGWQVYGQLNFGVLSVDNGGSRETYFAEIPHVPSRLGVLGELQVGGQDTLRFQVETGFGLTNLSAVSPENDGLDLDLDRTALRVFEISYASPRFGRVSLGQGSMASDGASGTDLSRTGLAIGPAIGD